jgi:hypothetical protein
MTNGAPWCGTRLFGLGAQIHARQWSKFGKQIERWKPGRPAQHWYDNFGDRETAIKDVIDKAEERFEGGLNNGKLLHQDFHAGLAEVALDGKSLSANQLGNWIRANSGKIVGGLYDRSCETDQKLAGRRLRSWKKAGPAPWFGPCARR